MDPPRDPRSHSPTSGQARAAPPTTPTTPHGNRACAGHTASTQRGLQLPAHPGSGCDSPSAAYIPQQPPRRCAGAERTSKMVLLRQAYGALFRRTSAFALSVVLGAVLFERAFDQGADALFEQLNQGVRAG